MAQRKLKITLASTLANIAAQTSIWVNNQLVGNNISVTNDIVSPLTIEYTFEVAASNSLKIALNNDQFFENGSDLNLIVSSISLSNEDGSYPAYTYLVNSTNDNLRSIDNTELVTATLWKMNDYFELVFDVNNLVIWYDYYQYDIDNPPPPEEPIV